MRTLLSIVLLLAATSASATVQGPKCNQMLGNDTRMGSKTTFTPPVERANTYTPGSNTKR